MSVAASEGLHARTGDMHQAFLLSAFYRAEGYVGCAEGEHRLSWELLRERRSMRTLLMGACTLVLL